MKLITAIGAWYRYHFVTESGHAWTQAQIDKMSDSIVKHWGMEPSSEAKKIARYLSEQM